MSINPKRSGILSTSLLVDVRIKVMNSTCSTSSSSRMEMLTGCDVELLLSVTLEGTIVMSRPAAQKYNYSNALVKVLIS